MCQMCLRDKNPRGAEVEDPWGLLDGVFVLGGPKGAVGLCYVFDNYDDAKVASLPGTEPFHLGTI